jgi:hypothetical protein
MARVNAKQIETTGAGDGYVIKYSDVTELWEADPEALSVPSQSDMDFSPVDTSGDGYATGIYISDPLVSQKGIEVLVNGISYVVGNGTKSEDCYFSVDNGDGARYFNNIEVGDELYWNGTIVGFDLSTSDRVDVNYDTSDIGALKGVFGYELIERKTVTADTSSVTFSGLDGDTDKEYLLTFNILSTTAGALFDLQPNGLTTNLECFVGAFNFSGGGSVFSGNEYSLWYFAEAHEATATTKGHVFILASKEVAGNSFDRSFKSRLATYKGGDSYPWGNMNCGYWRDNTSNLTSLIINESFIGGNEILQGSEFSLFKIKQS